MFPYDLLFAPTDLDADMFRLMTASGCCASELFYGTFVCSTYCFYTRFPLVRRILADNHMPAVPRRIGHSLLNSWSRVEARRAACDSLDQFKGNRGKQPLPSTCDSIHGSLRNGSANVVFNILIPTGANKLCS
jgi:hypothetical protein